MTDIQDGWQDVKQHVQVENWPKFNGIWFLLQVCILNGRAIVAFLWFLVLTLIQNFNNMIIN